MAHRLLPFRQYDENDVVNLFALDCSLNLLAAKPGDDGVNADGVLVSVTAGNASDDVINAGENGSFMNSYSSPVGRNPYPTNPLKVSPAASGAQALGVTLRQTLSIDENNEQLLYNPIKKDELNAVLSGQTVPVLTKGLITVHENAVKTDAGATEISVGGGIISAGGGQIAGLPSVAVGIQANQRIGTCVATGSRGGNYQNGMNADSLSGNYYLIKLG